MKTNNTYFLLRHGEARSNKDDFVSSWPEKKYNPITLEGKKQIQKIIPVLKKEKIDLIFSSDLLRTAQTAKMVAKNLCLKINFDKRLREISFGVLNGKKEEEWDIFFGTRLNRFVKRPLNGENYRDIRKRLVRFLREVEKKYENKNILIISHGAILFSLQVIIMGLREEDEKKDGRRFKLSPGEFKEIC